jgi:hypothetical protein
MHEPRKKPSRKETLARLEEVAGTAVGHTALDDAFAAFDDTIAKDPEKLAAMQARVRALLAPEGPPLPAPESGDDSP